MSKLAEAQNSIYYAAIMLKDLDQDELQELKEDIEAFLLDIKEHLEGKDE